MDVIQYKKILDLQSEINGIDNLLGIGDPVMQYTMPEGYKSAAYSNAAGTSKYKWENDVLVLKKANGSFGEISSTNASLSAGAGTTFAVDGSKDVYFGYAYENANDPNLAFFELRYYELDFSAYSPAYVYLPVGNGEETLNLKTLAIQNNIDLSDRPNVFIRRLKIEEAEGATAKAVQIEITGFGVLVQQENRINIIENDIEELQTESSDMQEDIKKTSGLITFLSRENVPAYYLEAPVSPASFDDMSHIESAIARVPKGKSFIYVTDTHWESNAKNTFKLIQYVKNRLGISKVLFGGDCIDRGSTKYIGLNIERDFLQEAFDALGGDFISTIGNHDLNTANAINDQRDYATYRIPYNEIYKVFLSRVTGITTEDWSTTIASIAQSDADAAELTGWTKLHYHVDDVSNKTRYIVIYSSAYDGVIVPAYTGFAVDGGGGPTTVMQYEWFARTLMSTPAGYDIIVLAHCADAENKAFPERQVLRNYFDFFVRIASAFHKKCSGYKIDISNFSEQGCPTNAFWTRETKQWDFTSAPDVGKILFMAGHIHRNVEYVSRIETDSTVYPTYERGKARNNGNPALVGVVEGVEVFDSATVDFSTGEMLTIISQCDAYNRDSSERYPYEVDEMTINTVKEQSFDVITLTDTGVVCTRFGAGWDRTIPVKWLPSN